MGSFRPGEAVLNHGGTEATEIHGVQNFGYDANFSVTNDIICFEIFSQLKLIRMPLGLSESFRYESNCALYKGIIISTAFNSTTISSLIKTSSFSFPPRFFSL